MLVVDYKGNMRVVKVARNKIERRPFLLIRAKVAGKGKLFPKAVGGENGGFHTFVQQAETIMLIGKHEKRSKLIRADQLKKGDEVFVRLSTPKLVGRHFGIAVQETIIEQ